MDEQTAATNKKEMEEFLQAIETDFYLHLDRYIHYVDKMFDTDPLTITQLLQMCEGYIIMETATKYVHNELPVGNLMYVVWDRVSNCGDNKLRSAVTEIILDMECTAYAEREKKDEDERYKLLA